MGSGWHYGLLALITLAMPVPLAFAQVNLKQVLQCTPTSGLRFSPHTRW